MSENYFASREQTEAPVEPQQNFFAQQSAEREAKAEEVKAERPMIDRLTEEFGSAADYKSPAEHAQTAVSDAVSWTAERVVDMGFTMAKWTAQFFLPDEWEDAIVDYSERGWTHLMENPTLQEGIEMAKQGMDVYNEWAEANPEYARRLNEIINIGAVSTPKVKPGTPMKYPGLESKAKLFRTDKRDATHAAMMEPIGKKGPGTLKIDAEGKKVYQPTPWEKDVNIEVMKTPGVDPKKPYTHNMNAVRAESAKAKRQLDLLAERKGGPIDTDALKATLTETVESLGEETLLSGDATVVANKIFQKASKLIDEAPPTSAGILQVRRDLDSWVNSQRNVFDSSFENATTTALRPIRQALNDAVGESTHSATVKALLAKQNKLLSAGDILESKALKEADSSIGRMIQKLEAKSGEKIPTTPLAQAATVGYAVTKGGVIAAALPVIGGYKGLKWLATPPGKLWLKKAKDLAIQHPILRPDVNALIQLTDGLQPEEE